MVTVGIDLGTTNSLLAYWSGEKAEIIPNIIGENLTPSVVSVDETGEILVGQIAKERLITHPDMTAAVFKRFMGTDKKYQLGEYDFTPEELSSFVLRALKADAEDFFGQSVENAVISVPAYFNDIQRKATIRAAELAGLKVERLINEPTAAALSYDIHQQEESAFLVFDLGGGTFDVSVLELFEGVIEVRAVAGDNFLGGEDFTEALVSYFLELHKIDRVSIDLRLQADIYKQAELCKIVLGRAENGQMKLILEGKVYESVISPNDFENIVERLIFRLCHPIERALRDASLHPEELNFIILVGGATRMPVVKSAVGKILKQLPYSNINPDEAIALGAAVQAALIEQNEFLQEVIMTDVCPYTLGTAVSRKIKEDNYESGFFLPIIQRNTSIPVSRVERLYTIVDNQTQMSIDVYQGEGRRVENNLKIGELEVQVPPAPKGDQPVDVRYTYDINGILEVETTVVKTGTKRRLIIESDQEGMSRDELEERMRVLESLKIHPREQTENRLLLAKGNRLYQETLGDNRKYIGDLLGDFEAVLAGQNEKEVRKKAKALKNKLEKIERWWGY